MLMSDGADELGKVICRAVGNTGAVGTGSSVLDTGQRLIAGLRATTGWGRPEAGDSFGVGATGFNDVARTVATAQPGDAWVGAAALAYASATHRQIRGAESLALLDRYVQTIVAREAGRIAASRDSLDGQSDRLTSVGRVTSSMAQVPGVGPAITAAMELTAVHSALDASVSELEALASETGANAAQLRTLATGYSDIGDDPGPEPPPTDPGAEPVVVDPAAPRCPQQPVAEAQVPSAAPGDPMSGLSTALGTVGGMIGSVVAPLTAVLTGVVAAAAQSLSAVNPGDAAAVDADVTRPREDGQRTRDATESEGAEQDSESARSAAPSDDVPAPPTPVPVPPPPVVPPAAIRPPQ
jgi:hypothetical protein